MIRIRRIASPRAAELHRRMERVMESLLHGVGPAPGGRGFLPRADIHETTSGMRVTIEIPGIQREEMEIVIEGDFLRVSGYRREPQVGDCLRWHQMEINYGPFERVISLPPEADPDRVSATYRDGFLVVTIPLRQAGAPRQVPVESR